MTTPRAEAVDTIAVALRKLGRGVSADVVSAATGIALRTVSRLLPEAIAVPRIAPRRMLPMVGERHRCVLTLECLDELDTRFPHANTSSCPVECGDYVPIPQQSGWQTGEHPIARGIRLHGQADEDDPTTRRRAR